MVLSLTGFSVAALLSLRQMFLRLLALLRHQSVLLRLLAARALSQATKKTSSKKAKTCPSAARTTVEEPRRAHAMATKLQQRKRNIWFHSTGR